MSEIIASSNDSLDDLGHVGLILSVLLVCMSQNALVDSKEPITAASSFKTKANQGDDASSANVYRTKRLGEEVDEEENKNQAISNIELLNKEKGKVSKWKNIENWSISRIYSAAQRLKKSLPKYLDAKKVKVLLERLAELKTEKFGKCRITPLRLRGKQGNGDYKETFGTCEKSQVTNDLDEELSDTLYFQNKITTLTYLERVNDTPIKRSTIEIPSHAYNSDDWDLFDCLKSPENEEN